MTESHAYEPHVPGLLWPPDRLRSSGDTGLSDARLRDLGIDPLIAALDWDGRNARFVRTTLAALVTAPDVIAFRQAIVAELRDDAALRDRLAALMPALRELGQPRAALWADESPLLLVPPRLSDLELYVACVTGLESALANEPRSAGLRALRSALAAIRQAPEFQLLERELPALRERLDQVGSLTIGVNLDRDLRPASVTLVDINREQFSGPRTLVHRLLGRAADRPGGITALHRLGERDPATDPLARDIQQLLREVVQPVADALERYARIHARSLAAIAPELALLLGAVRLAERLQSAGLPVCLPEIGEPHALDDAYNPSLALQLVRDDRPVAIVCNPADFEHGAIMFVTGPNRGGKTTYLRAIGINQVLFQAGIFVAARAARLQPADMILTHFPLLETGEPGTGRLDDEARRLRDMFDRATPASLLLFNEPLTSTGESEALLLAEDVLRALRLLGARTVYVTHLHALGDDLDALNRGPGATIASWVAGVDQRADRTYEIRPGPPLHRSHADLIARQHGITFAQLADRLAGRGVIDPPVDHRDRRQEMSNGD